MTLQKDIKKLQKAGYNVVKAGKKKKKQADKIVKMAKSAYDQYGEIAGLVMNPTPMNLASAGIKVLKKVF